MNLDQAQLQKQLKELEAKQEFIDSQLKFLEYAPLSVKVYEARIQAAETKLRDLENEGNTKLSKAGDELESIKLDHKRLLDSNRELGAERQSKEEEINLLDRRLIGIKKAIKEAQHTIDERRRYAEAQEELINSAAEEANLKLLDLKEMGDGLTDEIKELKIEKISLEKATDSLNSAVQLQEVELENLTNRYEDTKHKLSLDLKQMEGLIAEKKLEYQQLSKNLEATNVNLRERELSLKAKNDALVLEKQKLATDKRRFESQKELVQ